MVQSYVSGNSIEKRHFEHRIGAAARGYTKRRLDVEYKFSQVRLERNRDRRLSGFVQMSDAYIGGERSGKRGRGSEAKTPFVAAVSTTGDGKPGQIILRRVICLREVAIAKLLGIRLASGAEVDWCFGLLHGRHNSPIQACSKSNGRRRESCQDACLQMGKPSAWQRQTGDSGTYRAVSSKHVPRYIAEFQYRFNVRYDLPAMIPRLAYTALGTAPMPYPP